MRPEIIALAFAVGACNWAFRYFPTRARLHELPPGSRLARFLAATGPAAIGTLFVASALPLAREAIGRASGTASLALVAGVGAVLAVFALTRSVVGATLAGAVAYGLATWAAGWLAGA